MTVLKFLLLALAATATNVAGQTIYQCRNQAGKVRRQDSACPDNSKTEWQGNPSGNETPIIALSRPPSSTLLPSRDSPRVCPSLRQSYQHALDNSQRAMLSNNPAQIQRASEAIQRAGSQMSKYKCE